jgi:hypothetical protein
LPPQHHYVRSLLKYPSSGVFCFLRGKMGPSKPRLCQDFQGASCQGGKHGGPKQLAGPCKFGGLGVCGEMRCAEHCLCARSGLRTGASAARSRVTAAAPPPPPPAKASQPAARAPRSRSPMAHSTLRITPRELEDRMRSQHRFLPSRNQWPLEPSWGYGEQVLTWAEAVGHPSTTKWLATLDRGVLWSAKLQIFLRWARQQQNATVAPCPAPAAPQAIPPCVVCLTSPPSQACVPCHHLCLCGPCSLLLHQEGDVRCPVCRSPAASFVRVFY